MPLEGIFESRHDRCGQTVTLGFAPKAVIDPECDRDWTDDVPDKLLRRSNNALSVGTFADRYAVAEVVPQLAQIACLRIFVQGQCMAALKVGALCCLVEEPGPSLSLVAIEPGTLKVVCHRRGTVQRQCDCDRLGRCLYQFRLLDEL